MLGASNYTYLFPYVEVGFPAHVTSLPQGQVGQKRRKASLIGDGAEELLKSHPTPIFPRKPASVVPSDLGFFTLIPRASYDMQAFPFVTVHGFAVAVIPADGV